MSLSPELIRETGTPRAVRTAAIAGLGHAFPQEQIGNEPIAARVGVDSNWIERRTGISRRHRARPGERLSELAAQAGRNALADADIDGDQIDLVIVATITADERTPGAAPLVADAVGAAGAGAFDLGAACPGFVSALTVGSAAIESGRAEHVLVIGSELMSRVLNHDDRATAGLFGDGAGAAVLGTSGRATIGASVLGSDAALADLIVIEQDERLIRMKGHETFGAAVDILSRCTHELCDRAEIELGQIDLFVFHQANSRILKAVGERLELPADRVFECIADCANLSAASIPVALSHANDEGRLPERGRVLLASVGAGFNWGAALLEFSPDGAA